MAEIYSAQIAASGYAANTDTLALEITAPANVGLKIRKIRVMHDDGTAVATADYHRRIKLVRQSTGGTGGTSYTPIKLDANAAASGSTVKTNLTTTGTVTDTIDVFSIHAVSDFYWQAYDDEDMISVAPGGIFGIVLNPAG